MTKREQKTANFKASLYFDIAMMFLKDETERTQLRTCNARVLDCGDWYILQSYNTIIACIHKPTHKLYDLLRREYGYTATSAQHISKFAQDYGATEKITWRSI